MKKNLGIVALIALGAIGISSVSLGATGESQVVVSCDTGATQTLTVSDLNFGTLTVSSSQQTQTGTWTDGGAGFTGLKLVDNKAACGETGSLTNLWIVSLSFDTLSNSDGGTYKLQPNATASTTFSYGAINSGFVKIGIGMGTSNINHDAGSDAATDVVVPSGTYSTGTDYVTSAAKPIFKRTYLSNDLRIGTWRATPDMDIQIPGSLPAKTYVGTINVTLTSS